MSISLRFSFPEFQITCVIPLGLKCQLPAETSITSSPNKTEAVPSVTYINSSRLSCLCGEPAIFFGAKTASTQENCLLVCVLLINVRILLPNGPTSSSAFGGIKKGRGALNGKDSVLRSLAELLHDANGRKHIAAENKLMF